MNRKNLNYKSFPELSSQMAEGNTSAMAIINELIKNKGENMTLTLLLILDDINIRGIQIVTLYKMADKNIDKLYEKILTIDKTDIDKLNKINLSLTPHKAVFSGSKEDRMKNPDKYLFKQIEVQNIRKAKERSIVEELLKVKPIKNIEEMPVKKQTPKETIVTEKIETLTEINEEKPKFYTKPEVKEITDLYPNIMSHDAIELINKNGFICGYETTYKNEEGNHEIYRVFYNDKKDILYVHSLQEGDLFLWGDSKLNVVRQSDRSKFQSMANTYTNIKGVKGYNIELRDCPFEKLNQINNAKLKPINDLKYDYYDNNLIPIIESVGAMKFKKHNHDYNSCVIAEICNLLVFPETYKKLDDGLKEIYKPLLKWSNDKAYDEIIYQLNFDDGITMAVNLQDALGIKLNQEKLLAAKARYDKQMKEHTGKKGIFTRFIKDQNSNEIDKRIMKVLNHKISPVYITE